MSWDEHAGRISSAFDEWLLVDRDQRGFLALGLRFARESYERIWEGAAHEPGDLDGSELVDVFNDRIEGLWPNDYEWMHAAAVIRDAVTNYEVYLEKAREEMLRHHGHANIVAERAPYWKELREFFSRIGADIAPAEVTKIRDLRHFLVHRRGEIRTGEERRKFAEEKPDQLPALSVELPEEQVLSSLSVLGAAVRSVDAIVYRHTWGGEWLEALRPTLGS
jgi:hypothetical protein